MGWGGPLWSPARPRKHGDPVVIYITRLPQRDRPHLRQTGLGSGFVHGRGDPLWSPCRFVVALALEPAWALPTRLCLPSNRITISLPPSCLPSNRHGLSLPDGDLSAQWWSPCPLHTCPRTGLLISPPLHAYPRTSIGSPGPMVVSLPPSCSPSQAVPTSAFSIV